MGREQLGPGTDVGVHGGDVGVIKSDILMWG